MSSHKKIVVSSEFIESSCGGKSPCNWTLGHSQKERQRKGKREIHTDTSRQLGRKGGEMSRETEENLKRE